MKCLHHDDLDGRCAGWVVSMYTKNKNPKNYYECGYTTDIKSLPIEKDENVYIVDFSFGENTLSTLEYLLNKTKNITWVDHHATSIELLKNHPDLKNRFKGLSVSNKASGAALAYMYFWKRQFREIPMYIQLVSDYDTWTYNFGEDTEFFKLGTDCYDTKLFSGFWEKLQNEEKAVSDYGFVSNLVNDGRVVRKYLKQKYQYQLETYSYDIDIDFHGKKLKALVVNVDGNSWVFGETIHDKSYDVFILWSYDGEYYHYSLYSDSDRKDAFNVSKLAEENGGGGHENASGVQSKNRIW